MATFKAGDTARVNWKFDAGRIVRLIERDVDWTARAFWRVEPIDGKGELAAVPGCTRNGFVESVLEPLTPPAEDAWAADAVRKVTRPVHVEPVVVKEKA